MTLSRWSKISRRSELSDKPSVEIFVAVSAVNVAMFAVIGEIYGSRLQDVAAAL